MSVWFGIDSHEDEVRYELAAYEAERFAEAAEAEAAGWDDWTPEDDEWTPNADDQAEFDAWLAAYGPATLVAAATVTYEDEPF